jgi:hypothetical protein
MDSFLDTPEGRGTVVDIDLLRQRVKVRMEDAPETISWFANADIAVLRNGKAKKNDPPIPADLAPISGSGKRVRKEPESDEKLFLDRIKFRYSTEAVVEEQPEAAAPVTETEEAPKQNRSRRRKKPQGEKPEVKAEQPKAEKPEKKDPKPPKKVEEPKENKPSEPAEGEEAPKKPRRRPPYRRYRKPKQGGEG